MRSCKSTGKQENFKKKQGNEMPHLINSKKFENTPVRKVERACEQILHTYLEALNENTSSINESQFDLVYSCVNVISELRSQL